MVISAFDDADMCDHVGFVILDLLKEKFPSKAFASTGMMCW